MRSPALTLVSALLAAATAGGVACSRGAGDPRAGRRLPPPLVAATHVVARDVPVEIRAPVDLRPLESSDVGSKILGYLDAVFVDRGDRVHRGQLLAIVRPSDLPDQLAVQRSALAQAQASAALAHTNYERATALAPSGAMSQQELQQASSALAAAEAAQAATRSQIDALAVRLGETRINSPLDGVVSQRRLDPGALVGLATGGVILTVVRADVLRAFVAVDEAHAHDVVLGQNAHVEVDALPGRSFSGRVARIAPTFDPTSRTLDAEVQLQNEAGVLLPGMYGQCSIVVDIHHGAPVIPVTAAQVNTREAYTFVVEGSIAHRRTIEIGVDGGNWLEVTRGLRPGEVVVRAGADGLADGTPVRVALEVDPFSGEAGRPAIAQDGVGTTPPATAAAAGPPAQPRGN